MTIKDFIKKYREEIDEVILRSSGYTDIDDDERELWVLNCEELYLWAIWEVEDLTLE